MLLDSNSIIASVLYNSCFLHIAGFFKNLIIKHSNMTIIIMFDNYISNNFVFLLYFIIDFLKKKILYYISITKRKSISFQITVFDTFTTLMGSNHPETKVFSSVVSIICMFVWLFTCVPKFWSWLCKQLLSTLNVFRYKFLISDC